MMSTPLNSIKKHKTYCIVLLCSVLFFLKKVVQYALLDSYIPMLIIVLISGLISLSLYLRKRITFMLRFWSILLIIWSSVRILFFIANTFTKEIAESHLNIYLFGVPAVIISIIFLVMGIYLFRNARKIKHNGLEIHSF